MSLSFRLQWPFYAGCWQYPFLTNLAGRGPASFSLAVQQNSHSQQPVMQSQLHSDTFEHSKKTPFEWNGLSFGGLRNWHTKLCLFGPFSPEILSAVFLIVWESAIPLWMGWSQLTALPVKPLPCSSDTSKSFPTTIWLSWGFNLYPRRGFHFHEQLRSCPVLSQQIQPTRICNIIRKGASSFLRNPVTKRVEHEEEESWNEPLAQPWRLLSVINDGNYHIILVMKVQM